MRTLVRSVTITLSIAFLGSAVSTLVEPAPAAAVTDGGAIEAKYRTLGGEAGPLGPAVGDEQTTIDRVGRRRQFKRGHLYFHPATGAHVVPNDVFERWRELGLERGFGYPIADPEDGPDGTRLSRFQFGTITAGKELVAPLSFFAQNMALLAPPPPYKGTERTRTRFARPGERGLPLSSGHRVVVERPVLESLIAYVKEHDPDVIGLSEIFVDGERDFVRNELSGSHPHVLAGPDESGLESDGGLLVLSRYPIVAHHRTIYRQCLGVDCLANKGVLHVRIAPENHPTAYDVYLSHAQNPNEAESPPWNSVVDYMKDAFNGTIARRALNTGLGGTALAKLKYQMAHLGTFVAATRDRNAPALLMGDLNVDAFDTDTDGRGPDGNDYRLMLSHLGDPTDVWAASGEGLGATGGDNCSRSFFPGSFYEDQCDGRKAFLPPYDPARFDDQSLFPKEGRGTRIDYLLSWPGIGFPGLQPIFEGTDVVNIQTASRRDLSDHYGLTTRQRALRPMSVTFDRAVGRVRVQLAGYHCLQMTDGGLGFLTKKNPDEVEFEMSVTPSGEPTTTAKSGVVGGVRSGHRRGLRPMRDVTLDESKGGLDIDVKGWEVDVIKVLVKLGTSKTSLGKPRLTLSDDELRGLIGNSKEFILPLLAGGGGEYAVIVRVLVDAAEPVPVQTATTPSELTKTNPKAPTSTTIQRRPPPPSPPPQVTTTHPPAPPPPPPTTVTTHPPAPPAPPPPNLAVNDSFEKVGPNGPRTTWRRGNPVPAPSAAANWFMHSDNHSTPVLTAQVPSTRPGGGGTMLHTIGGGNEGGVFQEIPGAPAKLRFSAWVFVNKGQVVLQPSAMVGPNVKSTKTGEWEFLKVVTDSTKAPTGYFVIVNTTPEGADFFLDSVDVREVR